MFFTGSVLVAIWYVLVAHNLLNHHSISRVSKVFFFFFLNVGKDNFAKSTGKEKGATKV